LAEVREQRKTVTAVFCDLVGSTTLGESTDPEAVRALLRRYFERMRRIVEAHGGTVQKFIGDAVVAVFGVPVVHEDDALRAVRAAVEMRAGLPDLELEARIGVNTGEVVTSSDDTLVTGDAVNVAARLQQAAAPGEILIGEPTRELARDAISVEALPPLELKGKADAVAAFRLIGVEADAPGVARRQHGPIVGRDYELGLLDSAFEGALRRRGCQLFTVLGEAGVGKSRLVREFLSRVEARVAEGRCLSYGEGITYLPVVEVVEQLGGADEALLADSPGAAQTLRSLLGETAVATTPAEINWAVRKLFEAAAAERPLVVVFDDIQWGTPTFLDLIEHVAELSRDAPILLLCMGRPELLDTRPGWGGGKLNAATVALEPLGPAESGELITRLLGDRHLEPDLAEQISATAGGNPLYLEEMLAMIEHSGRRDLVVPPSIRALLAARLDQLDPPERSVLDRGSIEGQLFHEQAVVALAPDPAPVQEELVALVRKDLVRPDRPQLPGGAYRFRHLLIRDAAYDAQPKSSRGELHERFADWLADHSADLVERDELLGYHLEQAHNYRTELGTTDAALGDRAAAHLTTAAQRARDRGDRHAEAKLLERALALGISDPRERASAQIKLGNALNDTGHPEESERVLTDAATAAAALADRGLAAHATFALSSGPRLHLGDRRVPVDEVIDAFTQLGDDLGLSRALLMRATQLVRDGRFQEGQALVERALVYAEASGDREQRRDVIRVFCTHLGVGPTPVGLATARVEELLAAAVGDWVLEAAIKPTLAGLYAMAGRSEDALTLARESIEALADLGSTSSWSARNMAASDALELAGDLAAAERERKDAIAYLRNLRPDNVFGPAWMMGASLARLYCDGGRWDEAEEALAYGREAVIPTMPMSQIRRLAVEARLAAHRGELEEAVALAERAVAESATREWPNHLAEMWLALAEVQLAAGRRGETDAAVARALELYEQKGNVAAAARVRARIEAR
jgi:class 3 adenylate cyclase/tetratricopeptide (TPR) repeat protein